MKRSELIDKYFAQRREKDAHFGGYPFVCISRQAGAGGHSLGEMLLKKTEEHHYADLFRGWMMFDKELCEAVATEEDLRVSLNVLVSEEYHSDMSDYIHQLVSGETPQFAVYKRLFEIVRTLAAVGKVIIVGRGGSFVTRNMQAGISVRLVAPEEMRVEAIKTLLNESTEEAKKRVAKHARESAHFVRDLFASDINDAGNYDRLWDTGETPIEDIADTLMGMIKDKAAQIGRA